MEPFLTAADLQTYLKLPNGNVDEQLAMMAVESACNQVTDELDQQVLPTSTTFWVHGSGTERIHLQCWPLIELTAVYINEVEQDLEDFSSEEDGQLLVTSNGIFPLGYNNIKLEYEYGYNAVPGTLRVMALNLAARIYEFGPYQNDSTGGVTSNAFGGVVMTDDEKVACARYARKVW